MPEVNNYPTFNLILTDMYEKNKLAQFMDYPRTKTVLIDMMTCHTAACGYVKEVCPECGHMHIHYGSCNNSSCPQCGAEKRKAWAEKESTRLVNAPYYHIIFTVPDKYLNGLFLEDPEYMYNALMRASSKTISEFSKDPKYLGVKTPGFFSTLHTFSSSLCLHCHVHMVFCAGGLDKKGNFVKGDDSYLFPAKAVAKKFRGLFMAEVSKKYEYNGSPWISDIISSRSAKWNVEICSCKGDAGHVIKYLARYINRSAISNGRLISYKNDKVRFLYKNYRAGGKWQKMELDSCEFIRRFTMHILPKGFIRVRRYGFLSNNSGAKLKLIQELSQTVVPEAGNEQQQEQMQFEEEVKTEEKEETIKKLVKKPKSICPKCGKTMKRTRRYRLIHLRDKEAWVYIHKGRKQKRRHREIQNLN